MGYSTYEIKPAKALSMVNSTMWRVVSASTEHHFIDRSTWARPHLIERAELVEGEKRVFLRLKDGCFVELEKLHVYKGTVKR